MSLLPRSARRSRTLPPPGSLSQLFNTSSITILPALASVDLSRQTHGAAFTLLTPDEVSHELASLQATLSEAEESHSRATSKRSTLSVDSRKTTKEPSRNASKESCMIGGPNGVQLDSGVRLSQRSSSESSGDEDTSNIRTRLVQGSLGGNARMSSKGSARMTIAGPPRRGRKPRSRTPSKEKIPPESLNAEVGQLCSSDLPSPRGPPQDSSSVATKEDLWKAQAQTPNQGSLVEGPRTPSKGSARTPSKESARAGSKPFSRRPSKEQVRPESPNEQAHEMKWHVVLLGRTFREKTPQETADCLAEVLEIPLAEAFQKVASANDATTFVVSVCEDCLEADAKAMQLRSKGLRVQVASQAGLPGSDASTSPKKCADASISPKKHSDAWGAIDQGTVKPSYESIFRDADLDRDAPPRRTRRVNSIPCEKERRPSSLLLPSLLPDSIESLPQPDGESAQSKKVPLSRLQASVLLNFLITGNYHAFFKRVTPKEGRVSKREVRELCQFWKGLDDDRSNDIDRVEFQHYADRNLLNRYEAFNSEQWDSLPEWARMTHTEKATMEFARFIPRMRDKMADALFGSKHSFDLVALLGLTNPFASATSLKSLEAVFHDIFAAEFAETRAKTPPVLDINAYEDLCAVFEGFDKDRRGVLSIPDLAYQGLIQKDQMADFCQKLGAGGNENDLFDKAKFCEMMCQSGFRATEQSREAIMEDGRKIVLDPGTETWSWEL